MNDLPKLKLAQVDPAGLASQIQDIKPSVHQFGYNDVFQANLSETKTQRLQPDGNVAETVNPALDPSVEKDARVMIFLHYFEMIRTEHMTINVYHRDGVVYLDAMAIQTIKDRMVEVMVYKDDYSEEMETACAFIYNMFIFNLIIQLGKAHD